MKNFELKNKVVLITGSSSGIGKAAAAAFAKAGAHLALVARNEPALQQLRAELSGLGNKIEIFPFDLTQVEKIPALIEQVRQRLGAVDVLINNAGAGMAGLLEDCPMEEIRANFNVNFFAPLQLIRAVLPDMKQKKSGQIINLCSGLGRRGLPGYACYSSEKFAISGLTESLRLETAPWGIDVILVFPGSVSSEFNRRTQFFGTWKVPQPSVRPQPAEKIGNLILRASQQRLREVSSFGPGMLLGHLNYWFPDRKSVV